MTLYEQYVEKETLLESSVLTNLGLSALISLFWTAFVYGLGIVLSRKNVSSLPLSYNDRLSKLIRKITNDNEVKVFMIRNMNVINAFNYGTSNLYYSSGLVKNLGLTDKELIAILLHEYGHYHQKHIQIHQSKVIVGNFLLTGAVSFFTFFVAKPILIAAYLPSLGIPSYLGISKVTSYTEKKMEFEADKYMIKIGYAKAGASAFTKLFEFNKKLICGKIKDTEQKKMCLDQIKKSHLFSTHPPLEKRIDIIQSMNDKMRSAAANGLSGINKIKSVIPSIAVAISKKSGLS